MRQGFAALACLSLMLGSCAAPRSILSTSGERELSVESAFISLGPGTPRVLSVVERTFPNGARQTIRLATRGNTPGENSLRVDVVGATNADSHSDALLPDAPLKEAVLAADAEEALPDVPLRTSLTYVQNRYGPFGYAVGKSAQGDQCIYAWQRLATSDQALSVVNSRDTLAVRLRLCEPHVSESRLVAVMMGLNVNVAMSGGAWMPEPKPVSPDFAAPGLWVAPPEILTAATNPLPPRAVHVARRRESAPSTAPASPAPPGVLSPSPSVVVPPPPLASAAPIIPQAPTPSSPSRSNAATEPKS
jgi:Cellulose biosynthesis protein BcsN